MKSTLNLTKTQESKYNKSPEERLFMSVITQAFQDATYTGPYRELIQYKREAVEWFQNTTKDFKLPPPTLINTLFPHPLAYVMPIPNIRPPIIYRGHARREFLYGILESFISKNDKKFSIATPNIAIAAASIHDLNLERSPIFTQSDTAPIVQKLVFVTTKPRINPSIPI